MSFRCSNGHRMYCNDSRNVGEHVRRTYLCKECSERISTVESKVASRGASSWVKRRRDTKEFTKRAMDLKASITSLVEDAQRLVR